MPFANASRTTAAEVGADIVGCFHQRLLLPVSQRRERRSLEDGLVAYPEPQVTLGDTDKKPGLQRIGAGKQVHQPTGLPLNRAGSTRPGHRKEPLVNLIECEAPAGALGGEPCGDEPQIAEPSELPRDRDAGTPIGPRKRHGQVPLPDSDLEPLVGRAKLTLKQIHHALDATEAGAAQQPRHQVHHLSARAGAFQSIKDLRRVVKSHVRRGLNRGGGTARQGRRTLRKP